MPSAHRKNVIIYFGKATLEELLEVQRFIRGAMVANSKEGRMEVLDLSYFFFLSDLKEAFCFLVSLSPLLKIKIITSYPGQLLPKYCENQ